VTYRIKPLLSLSFILVFLGSCELFNTEEQLPAWIEVNAFTMVDNPLLNEGNLNADIQDIWLTIDGERIGTYELPARIPVLKEGIHQVVVAPGIIVSGTSALRDRYLYYDADTFEMELTADQTFVLDPITRYKNSTQLEVLLIEDFEDGDDRVSSTSASNAPFIRSADASFVKYGEGAGVMYLSDTVTNATIRTNGSLQLPQNGSVFMEVDVYSDYWVQWGVYVNSRVSDAAMDVYIMKPTDETWKKQYIGLQSTIDEAYGYSYPESFYLYAKAIYSPDSIPTSGNVIIDNVKVLYVK
jgi:hypothetical protein